MKLHFKSRITVLKVLGHKLQRDAQVDITQPTSSPFSVEGGNNIRVCFQCTPTNGYRVLGWNHNNTRIVASNRISLELSNTELCISALNPGDLGDYTCVGNNNAGQTRTASFVLLVTLGYSIETKRQQTIPFFQTGLVSCKVAGYPPPNITWRLNGTEIDFYRSNRHRLLGNGSLLIYNVNHNDSGRYRITVIRPGQQIPLTESINVNVGVYPRFYRYGRYPGYPVNVTVISGSNFTLSCNGLGTPTPNITWLGPNRLPVFNLRYRVTNGGRLFHIYNAQRNFDSEFTCRVNNTIATISGTAHVTIYEKPVISSLTNSLSIATGSAISLRCITTGYPRPRITWYRDGQFVNIGIGGAVKQDIVRGETVTSYLNMTNVGLNQAGIYTCSSSNNIPFTSNRTTQITTNVRAQVDSSFGLPIVRGAVTGKTTLLCRASGSPRPLIYWSKDNINITRQVNPSITITSKNLSSIAILSNLTIYGLNRSNFGNYNAAHRRIIQLQEISFPSFPRSVTVRSTTTHSLTISWSSPINQGGGIIQMYRIAYYRKNLRKQYQYTPSSQITLNNLVDNTDYIVEVSASNEAGYGKSATMIFRTAKPGLPSPPTNIEIRLLSKDSFLINWQTAIDNGGVPIISYIISYKLHSSRYNWSEFYVPSYERSHTIYNLPFGGQYDVRMFTYTKAGRSSPTRTWNVTLSQAQLSTSQLGAIIVVCIILSLIAFDLAVYYLHEKGLTAAIINICSTPNDTEIIKTSQDTTMVANTNATRNSIKEDQISGFLKLSNSTFDIILTSYNSEWISANVSYNHRVRVRVRLNSVMNGIW
ncbi:uncharacterized protein TRIADDRAFT_59528 [Trichoplax adhaerens]|uniref:Uncharacterized protein n=1 Tax=Trichoplax adhaerens TaxID=10228 RepID=B3S5W2_TRIAD|nr:hypothetical protein TRIADDRAFT_59528 [Trichoplax adhaerens]EDV21986.1 hypothetical protein TRIADDRAFT_59528 [Trichoplax adhaerens]|eukprot:XP_002115623.1 hypothetical protein TRIADDRAFT_59528 [Trichoplax adhaerens]